MDKQSAKHIESRESGRNGFTFNDELPLGKAIKAFPKVTLWILAVMSGILCLGFDTVIVGTITAVPRFQRDFGNLIDKSWILPAHWVSLWSALGHVGSVIGAIFSGWYQEKVGRRWSLATGSATAIVAIAFMFCSNLPDDLQARRGLFLFSKIVQGGAIGMILATTQTYVSEVVPVSLRGPAMSLFPAFTLLGQLIGAVVIFIKSKDRSVNSYRVSFAAQWPFAFLPLVVSVLMPESPAWLLQRERREKAVHAQSRFLNGKADQEAIFRQMEESVILDRKLAAETSYLDCFRGVDRRRTVIVIIASSLSNMFGLPLLANASYFMQQVGMSAFFSLLFLIVGIILGGIANGFGIWLMSRVGRRKLTLLSMSATVVLFTAMGVAGIWQGTVTIWYTAITLMAIVVVCGMACWPASFAVAAETSSLRLRARSQGISVLVSQIGNIVMQFVLPFIYNRDAADLRSKTGFVYAGICAVGVGLSWKYMPEMKGRTVAAIDHMFETHVPTRSFRTYQRMSELKHSPDALESRGTANGGLEKAVAINEQTHGQ